jgi:hypothetical protein
MSDVSTSLLLGFRHIADLGAADHLLFLLVLGAIYRPADWKAALLVVTAFTVGHSLTLVLAVTGAIAVPGAWVEFLIPVTIVATGIENLVQRERIARGQFARHRPVFALIFGLVHGAGFAGYLSSLLVDDPLWPLLGFNVGVELGQLLILTVAALGFAGVDALLGLFAGRRGGARAFTWRLSGVSVMVTAVAAMWAWERVP